MNISSGDLMQASIRLANATLDVWSINITDVTSGSSYQKTVAYAVSQLSAEWIVERPTINRVLTQLADFGNVTFTDCQAIVGSDTGGINSFASSRVVMYSSTSPSTPSVQLTDVSMVSTDGKSFIVTYLSIE
jgi:hypothetical protein